MSSLQEFSYRLCCGFYQDVSLYMELKMTSVLFLSSRWARQSSEREISSDSCSSCMCYISKEQTLCCISAKLLLLLPRSLKEDSIVRPGKEGVWRQTIVSLLKKNGAVSVRILFCLHFMKCGSLCPRVVDDLNGQTFVEMLDWLHCLAWVGCGWPRCSWYKQEAGFSTSLATRKHAFPFSGQRPQSTPSATQNEAMK